MEFYKNYYFIKLLKILHRIFKTRNTLASYILGKKYFSLNVTLKKH